MTNLMTKSCNQTDIKKRLPEISNQQIKEWDKLLLSSINR